MKLFLIFALLFTVASSVFAIGPQTVGSSHAESGYDSKDMAVTVVASPAEEGRMWLNANYSYPLLFSERDKLVSLAQTAAKKINIAVANKTTISYLQEIGRLITENGALVTVSFETEGYELSYAVVRITGDGNSDILFLNKKDTQDFVNILGNANSLVNDYQTGCAFQVDLTGGLPRTWRMKSRRGHGNGTSTEFEGPRSRKCELLGNLPAIAGEWAHA